MTRKKNNVLVTVFEDESAWLEARRGKVTGTRLKDLIVKRGTKLKKGFFEILAERVAIPADDESPLHRGKRLEDEAIEAFTKKTGKKVDTSLQIWQRKDCPNIALSPDGVIDETEAVEVKCLTSANQLEAWYYNTPPSDYEEQALQYFIVNDKLKTLYFVMYDPRLPVALLIFPVHRKDVKEKIDEYFLIEKEMLKLMDELEEKLTF